MHPITNKLIAAMNSFPYIDSPKAYLEQYQLAMELYDLIKKNEIEFEEFREEIEEDITGWLLDLPLALSESGSISEALAMGLAWSEITEADNFLGDRAIILAEAKQNNEAKQQAQKNLSRFPEDIWIQIKTGDVYQILKDYTAAELFYREALKKAETEYDREGILERLIPLLYDTGRSEEALELEEEINSDSGINDNFENSDPSLFNISRNEPCPCGSGKKFKKCCGLNQKGYLN